MSDHWFARRAIDVPCVVEIADTDEAFHAHVMLQGCEVNAGDSVLVHEAPMRVEPGTRMTFIRRATVFRAAWFDRLWTRLTSRFELTLLYEVSFTPQRIALTRKLAPDAIDIDMPAIGYEAATTQWSAK
jgi:hypothetical protein